MEGDSQDASTKSQCFANELKYMKQSIKDRTTDENSIHVSMALRNEGEV